MFRGSLFARNLVRGATASSMGLTYALCDSTPNYPFDTKGHNTKLIPAVGKAKAPLTLSGIGMRKKNLYVVEVDVYMVSIYLDEDRLKVLKEWKEKGENGLPHELLQSALNNTGDSPIIAINSKFVRNVGQKQVVEGLIDAFKDCDQGAVAVLKDAITEVIGSQGMKQGEEFQWFWYGPEKGLACAKNGVYKEIPEAKELEGTLLEIYVDPKKTVSPELVKCIRDTDIGAILTSF